jgi:hypothetical protein
MVLLESMAIAGDAEASELQVSLFGGDQSAWAV